MKRYFLIYCICIILVFLLPAIFTKNAEVGATLKENEKQSADNQNDNSNEKDNKNVNNESISSANGKRKFSWIRKSA